MATSPFIINRFGGLNVIVDPQEVGPEAAVSLLNVDTDSRGTLRTRDGYSNHTSSAAAHPYRSLSYAPSGHLLGVRSNGGGSAARMEAIDSAGAITDTEVGTNPLSSTPGKARFASIGSISNTFTHIVSPDFNVTWNGTSFAAASYSGGGSTPTGTSRIAAWKERLASVTGSQVNFSNAGDSLVFGANDFVVPDPGDGETTSAFVTWGDLLFLVRQTKMFVFYGVATDGDGEPIFNYRREVFGDLGSFQACVGAQDGLYVLTTKGLYKTAGGPMVLVSEQPRGLFSSLLNRSIPSDYSELPAAAFQQRLYFACPASGSSALDRTLVFDQVTNDWLLWDVAALSLAIGRYFTGGSLIAFGLASGHMAKLDPAVATDAGSAIAWNYFSGIYDLSKENRVAVTLESAMWGTGTVTLQVANDHGSVDTGSALTLGTSPAVAQTWQQVDREGTFWQHKLSGTAAATVNRFAHYVSFVKPTGVG